MKIFLKIFLFTILIKISLVLVGIGVANYSEYKFKNRSSFQFGQLQPSDWISIFHRFDSGWFSTIAKEGHSKIDKADLVPNEHNDNRQSYYAFFPLYPVLVGVIMKLTGAGFMTSAWWLSFFLCPVAFYLFYRLAQIELKHDDYAWQATLCIMLFPTNYYYYTYYTETLYLVLVLSVFVFTYYKKYLLLFLAMMLLALVRPNGILMALPLAIWFAEYFDPGLKNLLALRWKPWIPLIIAVSIMCITLAGYCYYLYEMTGDPLAFSTAQQGWGRHFKLPWYTVWHASGPLDPYFAAYTMVMLFFIVLTMHHWKFSFFVLMLISILIPLSTGLNTSMPRFWSVIFPLFIAMGAVTAQWKYGKWLPYLFWMLMLLNFIPWIIKHPFAI